MAVEQVESWCEKGHRHSFKQWSVAWQPFSPEPPPSSPPPPDMTVKTQTCNLNVIQCEARDT